MKEIKVEHYGYVHYVAFCQTCDFQEALSEGGVARVRSKVRSHVKKTGHEVIIEGGNATKYSLKL